MGLEGAVEGLQGLGGGEPVEGLEGEGVSGRCVVVVRLVGWWMGVGGYEFLLVSLCMNVFMVLSPGAVEYRCGCLVACHRCTIVRYK